jgi:endogenous inhibitor of DNA gyrase (YacG/DUF329 family)
MHPDSTTRPCACGCGQPVNHGNIFIRYHHLRTLSSPVTMPILHRMCPICNQPFSLKQGSRGHAPVHCSRKCAQVALASRTREDAPRWDGGRYKTLMGYVLVRVGDHYEMEHRVLIEEHIGRPLGPKEVVHHLNGKRDDNRLENLRVLAKRVHDAMETKAQWANGTRRPHAPPPRRGQVLTCPVCGVEHYEVPSKLRMRSAAFCRDHRKVGRPPRLLGDGSFPPA